jgi:hypothetical protein
MKRILSTLTLCIIFLASKGQDASVEKSIFGTQIGWLGVWVYNEAKLSTDFALRSEIGLTGTCDYYVKDYFDDFWFF